MPLHNDEELIARSFYNLFTTDNGRFVLEQLKRQWGVRHTLEPEEEWNRQIVERNFNSPSFALVDPILFAKRQGQKAAYWNIDLWIGRGRAIMERDSKDAG